MLSKSIKPSEGYKYLTDGHTWATEVWLGKNDRAERWHSTNEEPREEDMNAIFSEKNIRKGEFFNVQDELFRALENIPEGAKLSEGVNCEKVSVADALNEERSKE